jgi:phosphoglycolate phosphatase
MIKLLIYDLDGTLIDSRVDIANSVNWMLKQMGFSELSTEVITDHVGEGVGHLMKSVLKLSSGHDEEEMIERARKLYRGHYAEHLLDETKLYPAVPKVLAYFKPRKQAVITNKPEDSAHEILRGLKIESYFFQIIGTFPEKDVKSFPDTFGEKLQVFLQKCSRKGAQCRGGKFSAKPSPDSVFELMRLTSAGPEETAFIGDSHIDIQTGKAAGIYTIGVTYGFKSKKHVESARPDFVYDDLNALLSCPILV